LEVCLPGGGGSTVEEKKAIRKIQKKYLTLNYAIWLLCGIILILFFIIKKKKRKNEKKKIKPVQQSVYSQS